MFDKKECTEINIEPKGIYVEKNFGTIINNPNKPFLSNEELLENIDLASVDLASYDNRFQGKVHIARKETSYLYDWIIKEFDDAESRIAVLVGEAGYGKSVILKDLLDLLKVENVPVLGIKVDKILNINSLSEIEKELDLKDDILSIFQELSKDNQTLVLLIDQIDALSQSLSSNRNAINSYSRLIKRLEIYKNVRIIISCRTYDLNYDPILRSYVEKKEFKTSLLEIEQVEKVLCDFKIKVNPKFLRLKEFLRIPLHLNLFCKVGVNKQFDEEINLQKLYDAIWEEYILNDNSAKLIDLLSLISDIMNKQQHIVVDKRYFDKYTKELNYLLRNDLLKEYAGNKIQFIHQTFFDYVYARTFISSGNSVSNWLKNVHQGLFVRSQLRQTIAYLRDFDEDVYIHELKEILSGDYRFHLKLLLISSLGFYQNPFKKEKKLISDCVVDDPLYFQIFLESIQTTEWFRFIIELEVFKMYMKHRNEIDPIVINLCNRIVCHNTKLVVDFLESYPSKIGIIENVLTHVPESEISLTYNLYNKTSSQWSKNVRYGYYYLEIVLKVNPEFVITELKKDFEDNLPNIDHYKDKYIPGDYSGLKIYMDLYEQFPHKAIPYFLYVIEEIIKKIVTSH